MKEQYARTLASALGPALGLTEAEIFSAIESPKNSKFGDLALPCFELAKRRQIPPPQCARELADSIKLPPGFSSVLAVGPFLNFHLDRPPYIEAVIRQCIAGSWLRTGTPDKTMLLEYSSPNIAKSFHVGHLRATLIGNCLDKLYRFQNYHVESINHLGDWGTQFGFVWAGCELWGKPAEPTVSSLVDLYRRATSLKERQEKSELGPDETALPDVNEMARKYFVDLELGKEYAVEFWRWCLDISMVYFKATYERLGVHFDHYIGESFYSDKLEAVKVELEQSGLLQDSQGALGVDLGEELGFARIFTPDGRSLYLTRDIASAEYRARTFHFDVAIYVVGAPQTLHFQQLKAVLKALGKPYADDIIHVAFGHVLGMRTRGESGAIELHEFLDEAYERALRAYREQVTKRPEGLDESAVAEGVALSAIVFSNLSRLRLKDVHFNWDQALAFQGDTGPYLLYAYARINGIKERASAAGLAVDLANLTGELLTDDHAYALVTTLAKFESVLRATAADNEPSYLAMYALDIAKTFSKAYAELKVVGEEQRLAASRLALFEATKQVLGQTLELLGIRPLERM